jgi:zinc transport system permease protein
MAIGVLFIARTPGYSQDLMSYLFGNILMVSRSDLLLIAVLDVIVFAACMIWYDQLMAICFDEEHARLQGVPVTFYYLLLLCLCALTVVLLVTVVGAVLAIALLTLPSGVAATFARGLKAMMLYSVLSCAVFTIAGLGLSYGPDLPPGSVIVVIAGAAYLLAASGRTVFRRNTGS